MPKRKSNVKVENCKVVLSNEILKIIENWRTEENSEWVDKYLEIISDPSNIGSKKSRGHHIIPCFVFKDEEHKNRKETEPLANAIEGNIVELSIHNHILAHRCLWKIFKDNKDAKIAYQKLCKQEKIENLTDEEVNKIATLIEECAKENVTIEERKIKQRNYEKENKEKIAKRKKEQYKNNKKEILKKQKEYRKENKEKIAKQNKIYKQSHKKEISEKAKGYYKNNKEKISQKGKERYKNNKEKFSEKNKNYNNQECYDPIKEDFCKLGALNNRKNRHKNLYKNVIPSQCIIQTSVPST